MPGPVFLIAQQRSGTNLLRQSLATTPWFIDRDEIFHNRPDMGTYWTHRALMIAKDPLLSIPYKQHQNKLFNSYLEKFANSPDEFSLIDVKYNSLHNLNCLWQNPSVRPHLFTFLSENQIPVIHLIRQDVLASYVSSLVANDLNIYVTRSDDFPEPKQWTVDTSELINYVRNVTNSVSRTRGWLSHLTRIPSIELNFEELINDNGEICRDVLFRLETFLQIPDELSPHVLTKKFITRPYWQFIKNFEADIVPALKENGFNYLLPQYWASKRAA